MNIQLRDAKTKDEFVRRIAAKAKSLPKGEWILNGDWDHSQFDPVELPRKDWIDAVTPDHPVCVNRLDEHMILANSLALKLAGVTKATPVPAGGEIVNDAATGEPTGILKDAAMDLVYAKIPAPSPPRTGGRWKRPWPTPRRKASPRSTMFPAKSGSTSTRTF